MNRTDSLADKELDLHGSNQQDEHKDRQAEEQHLKYCVSVIQENIDNYRQKYGELSAETKELYDMYRSNNPELHNDLSIGLDMKNMMERMLIKNMMALKKPYFGRIDYRETDTQDDYCLYIGKNGVRKNITENLITDWRTPVAGVYYDSDIGKSSYLTPYGERIEIDLKLKRTYEVEDSRLIDYYDSEVVTNDEFLTKYLSKNKEVVLGEIIATIQKEQNEIIRDTPWHSVVVQGVAGSGKTTVAMHRISYILYNYKDKFRPDEFYIIGSNRMLLNYITGVLPNLDVYNINNMTMEEFLFLILDKDFDIKKGKYRLTNKFYKRLRAAETALMSHLQQFKGSMDFINALISYMEKYEISSVNTNDVEYEGEVIYSEEEILYLLDFFKELPLQEKIDMLNKRLTYKVRSINEEQLMRKEQISVEVNKFKNLFGMRNQKFNLIDVYHKFLTDLLVNRNAYLTKDIKLPSAEAIELLMDRLNKKEIDLYDLVMLTYIKKRLKRTKDFDYVRHIVVDEAQDFGVIVFRLFKIIFGSCTFTIMGDVTQNINYYGGMNDWEALRQQVLDPRKDKFYVMAKSYRNTVEISDYASRVLRKCTFKTYDIQPIIRHGKEVVAKRLADDAEMINETASLIKTSRESGYDTIAVICRTVEESLKVKEALMPLIEAEYEGESGADNPASGSEPRTKACKDEGRKEKSAKSKNKKTAAIEEQEDSFEGLSFTKGVMVLPIYMTKGLEFDTVILWNPDEESYHVSDEDAKLLYVAITRALHELHIIYKGRLSGLLE